MSVAAPTVLCCHGNQDESAPPPPPHPPNHRSLVFSLTLTHMHISIHLHSLLSQRSAVTHSHNLFFSPPKSLQAIGFQTFPCSPNFTAPQPLFFFSTWLKHNNNCFCNATCWFCDIKKNNVCPCKQQQVERPLAGELLCVASPILLYVPPAFKQHGESQKGCRVRCADAQLGISPTAKPQTAPDIC